MKTYDVEAINSQIRSFYNIHDFRSSLYSQDHGFGIITEKFKRFESYSYKETQLLYILKHNQVEEYKDFLDLFKSSVFNYLNIVKLVKQFNKTSEDKIVFTQGDFSYTNNTKIWANGEIPYGAGYSNVDHFVLTLNRMYEHQEVWKKDLTKYERVFNKLLINV